MSDIISNEEIAEARQDIIEKANPALKNKLYWIIDWQKTEISHSLLSRWDLGQEIDEVYEDSQHNGCKTFGRRAKTIIASFMREDPSVCNVAHRLYKLYPDRKVLKDITEMTMADTVTHLSYSHMRQLISIDDDQERMELLNKCLLGCWTSAELGKQIQALNGGQRTNNPRGRAASPKNAETVIAQQLDFVSDFENRNIKVWRDPARSLPTQIDKIDPSQYTDDLAKKLGELAHRMRQLADEAVARADEAEKKYDQVRLAIEARTAKFSPVDLVSPELDDDNGSNNRGSRQVGGRKRVA